MYRGREVAKRAGASFYVSYHRCPVCGTRFRHTHDMSCVQCRAEGKAPQQKLTARQSAAISGATRYEGVPCGGCGCRTRYVCNSNCVQCQNTAAREWARRNRLKAARSLAHFQARENNSIRLNFYGQI